MNKLKAIDQATKLAKQSGEVAYVVFSGTGYDAVSFSRYLGNDDNIVVEVDSFGTCYDHGLVVVEHD